ncbi:MAG: enolase C-terminal domain-like protein, partial [Solirubrobacteraceae bacterium]
MKLGVSRVRLRLRKPHLSSHGTLSERELLTVSLTDEGGVTGYGEAAPLEPYDGVSIARVEQALERYRPVLEGAADMNGAEIVDACRRVEDLPEAFAAIDLALWDLAGRRMGRPVSSLVTDTPARAVAVNATLSALDRTAAAEQARRAVKLGFACVKVKVGVGDDASRVAAVRAAAGPHLALRLDANGAWSVEQAVRSIEALAPVGLELVEEPVHGLSLVREVRARV